MFDNRVLVIGSGPAGLMAADTVSAAGLPVCLIEARPNFGRKILLAGRSGLNMTHGEEIDTFAQRYSVDASRWLDAFSPTDVMRLSTGLGEPCFKGSSGRVFPKSWRATGFLRAWLSRLQAQGLDFHPSTRLVALRSNGVTLSSADEQIEVAKPLGIILALGGGSWPRVGSGSAWMPILADAGLPTVPMRASNAGVLVNWSSFFRAKFAGRPLKSISVRLDTAPLSPAIKGDISITQTGLESGPIYSLSREVDEALIADGEAHLIVDFKPDLDTAALSEKLSKVRASASFSKLCKALGLPTSLPALLQECPQSTDEKLKIIKEFRIPVQGLASLDRAISSRGGLCMSAVDLVFALKGFPSVYAVGEMLDWDAPTGGYLIQACLSQGRIAGLDLVERLAPERGRQSYPN